jgi:hypothetical protein
MASNNEAEHSHDRVWCLGSVPRSSRTTQSVRSPVALAWLGGHEIKLHGDDEHVSQTFTTTATIKPIKTVAAGHQSRPYHRSHHMESSQSMNIKVNKCHTWTPPSDNSRYSSQRTHILAHHNMPPTSTLSHSISSHEQLTMHVPPSTHQASDQ